MWLLFLFIVITLLVLSAVFAPRTVPWADQLTRLNAGLGGKAEWMAPPAVIEQVRGHYREAQVWVQAGAFNWAHIAECLDEFTCGLYLAQQRAALEKMMHYPEPRLTSLTHAKHEVAVRYFSSDGLRCWLIDRQTQRTITTAYYWSKQTMFTQRLPEATVVYQMFYEVSAKRWQIEKLLQELPTATGQSVRLTVSAEMLTAAGRDN